MGRTGLDAATLARAMRNMAGDGSVEWVAEPIQASVLLDVADMLDENNHLRAALEGTAIVTDYWKDEDGTKHVLAIDGTETIEYMSGGLADENARLAGELEDLTWKHQDLIDVLTDSLLSKASTPNDAVVHAVEERYSERTVKLEDLCVRMYRFIHSACEKYPRMFDPNTGGRGQIVRAMPDVIYAEEMHELEIEVP